MFRSEFIHSARCETWFLRSIDYSERRKSWEIITFFQQRIFLCSLVASLYFRAVSFGNFGSCVAADFFFFFMLRIRDAGNCTKFVSCNFLWNLFSHTYVYAVCFKRQQNTSSFVEYEITKIIFHWFQQLSRWTVFKTFLGNVTKLQN